MKPRPPSATLLPDTTHFRSSFLLVPEWHTPHFVALTFSARCSYCSPNASRYGGRASAVGAGGPRSQDRKSTCLNSSHANISYAVFCWKKIQLKPAFRLGPND